MDGGREEGTEGGVGGWVEGWMDGWRDGGTEGRREGWEGWEGWEGREATDQDYLPGQRSTSFFPAAAVLVSSCPQVRPHDRVPGLPLLSGSVKLHLATSRQRLILDSGVGSNLVF